jgi:hypothetical protein
MTDPTTDPAPQPSVAAARRPKRGRIAIVVLAAGLAVASGAYWQHERSRAEAAVRANTAAIRDHQHVARQRRTAETRLNRANARVDALLATLDQPARLEALGTALGNLRADSDALITAYTEMIDAAARRDFTTYNQLVDRVQALVSNAITHSDTQTELHDELRLRNPPAVTRASAGRVEEGAQGA